jgi:hypothetical protein
MSIAITPDLAPTFAKGRDAFLAGEAEAANPFYPETIFGKAWVSGYEEARGPLAKIGPMELRPTIAYGAASIVSKTHRVAPNRFAAVGAIYFRGHRGMYVSATGETRRQAEANVMAILDPDPRAASRSESRLRAMGG